MPHFPQSLLYVWKWGGPVWYAILFGEFGLVRRILHSFERSKARLMKERACSMHEI